MYPAHLLVETIRTSPGVSPEAIRGAWSTAPDLSALVTFEGCAIFLHRRLAELGVRDTGRSPFGLWLARTAVKESARAMLVEAEAQRVSGLLKSRGIPHVFLKGVARRAALALLPRGDARTTNDVDVLVPEGAAEDAMRALRDTSYEVVPHPEKTPIGHYHLVPVAGRGGVAVEVHTSISYRIPGSTAWSRLSGSALEIQWSGSAVRIPGVTELLWHAVIHAVEREAAAFRLRYLLDAMIVLERAEMVEWDIIGARLESEEVADPRMATLWLGTAASLSGVALPASIPRATEGFDLKRTLDWRFQVLRRVQGFPRFRERLLVEGARGELALPVEDAVPGQPVLHRLRRRMMNHVARVTYLTWRGMRSRSHPRNSVAS